jgi:hypothetical protein
MALAPLNTSGTRYSLAEFGEDSWVFGDWAKFLKKQQLCDLSSFLDLSGDVVDRNRRSVVYRLKLGAEKRVFYLKLHTDFFRQNLRTLYRKVPVLYTELTNLMHYGRAGIDTLEPVAWGHRSTPSGGVGFILLEELEGFCSLQEWLHTVRSYGELKEMTQSCAAMVCKIHEYGLAHIDLFSWHIFVKGGASGYEVVPIDLERTKIRGRFPFAHAVLWFNQLHDLAVLNLTTPWPQVSDSLRLRFYMAWLHTEKLTFMQKMQAKLIVSLARYFGRKRKKFKAYGLAARFQQVRCRK